MVGYVTRIAIRISAFEPEVGYVTWIAIRISAFEPEVGYVTRIAIRISVFTWTRISLIRIRIWVKGFV